MIPVVFGITLACFIILRLMPGDPADLLLGTRATPEAIEALREQLGLDKPIISQYFSFLKDLFQGSLGNSIFYDQPVTGLVFERLPATLFLVLYSTVIAIIITLPLAILSALKKDSIIDNSIKGAFVVALSMPSFWLGVILILFFSIQLGIFPVSGYGNSFLDRLWHLFLPAFTIGLSTASLTIKSLRSSMILVLTADYVDTARAKGTNRRNVILKHVLRNALISTVSILGVHTSWVIGGTVVIETVFSIPGIGYLFVKSIITRDYPIIQGLTITFAMLVITINLLTDISYSIIDPRVSYD
jgi:peptide/nickel transport system permease protein